MKRIISDCFALEGERLYDGEQIFYPVEERGNYTLLDNGVWIVNPGDGRYCSDEDEFDRYAAVYDWDEDNDCGDLVGFVRL